MGLGLLEGGVGTAKFFCKQGAKVLVTDLKTKKQLKESIQKLKDFTIEYVLGRHRVKDFTHTDLIIKNPAVPNNSPYLKFAKQYNIPIESDISIFFKLSKAPIIGITGTKGKSTVATLIYLLLKSKYPKTILAGNIGISALETLPKINRNTKIVLELSSFELEDLKKSPHIAVITTLFPDHLNRYKNFKEYVKAKKSIFKYQKKNDVLILNYNDPETKKLASETCSKVYFFKGPNASAAIAVAKLFKISEKDIKKVLSNFKGLHDRQELVAVKRGVKYINDTTATTPQSAILAIKIFKNRFPKARIILIAGGQDKNLDYKNLAKEIKKKIDCLVLLPGTASNKIRTCLRQNLECLPSASHCLKKELRGLNSSIQIIPVNTMEKAIEKASKQSKEKDIVLLSPGAASFNLFKNEFDRGEQFKEAVKKLA